MSKVSVANTVNSRYPTAEVRPKLLISKSKISGSRKITLKYQYFEIKVVEMKIKIGRCVQTIFFDIRGYFEISLFEVSRADCLY